MTEMDPAGPPHRPNSAAPGPASPPQRPPGEGPRLRQPPGARYGAGGARTTGPGDPQGAAGPAASSRGVVRALLAADATALAGALVFFALGLVDVGPGLLAASAAIGWAVALALLWGGGGAGLPAGSRRMLVAAALAAAAVIVGFTLNWAWARSEGGTLDLLAYVDQRYGAIAWVNALVAGGTAAWRAR